jgi:hypothetical protein
MELMKEKRKVLPLVLAAFYSIISFLYAVDSAGHSLEKIAGVFVLFAGASLLAAEGLSVVPHASVQKRGNRGT